MQDLFHKYKAVLEDVKAEVKSTGATGPMCVIKKIDLMRKTSKMLIERHGDNVTLPSHGGKILQDVKESFHAAVFDVFQTKFVNFSTAGSRHNPRVVNQDHLVGFALQVMLVHPFQFPACS
jgi:hypothetical protein